MHLTHGRRNKGDRRTHGGQQKPTDRLGRVQDHPRPETCPLASGHQGVVGLRRAAPFTQGEGFIRQFRQCDALPARKPVALWNRHKHRLRHQMIDT